MGSVVMADSIAHLPEFAGWYRAIKESLGEIALADALVYIVDDIDPRLLPFLAEQFDVLGYKGFRMAQTDSDRREVIKRAIELHRYKGTEWAIKEALKSIGFSDIELKRGYDHWAKFGIKITNSSLQLTADSFNDIIQMVNEYKRAACVLVDVSIDVVVDDTLTVSNDDAVVLPATIVEDDLSLTGTLMYDGDGKYDGEFDHSGDSDIVIITPL
ncbi:phage tail protein [Chitinophaga sp. sic0106]|uniref:phage tail protein n=1 Tax=Chitinophaga sp. sic0106 TaxID=2854785 RepID=UPI001C43CBC8|nr:phage tail protein [Chitinophaga sp. sic0106]MBV7529045.1 phage tail protein [Chitinophaga sp. sic0106]